jgi:glycosyltransferase involved in cell wall biosynthesis
MIEALASGLPVISTRVSGSSILLESPAAGLVVDVGNVEMLADAMKMLLRDEAIRMRLGENARPTFESRFSVKTLSNRTILLYEGLRDRNEKRATA